MPPDHATHAIESWQIWLMFAINFVVLVKGLGAVLEIRDHVRDEMQDLRRIVGYDDAKHEVSGLVLDTRSIKKEIRHHRDTLIEVTAELGMRPPGGRT